MSTERRNYGNNQGFDNTIRLRYGGQSPTTNSRNTIERPNPDCITCSRHLVASNLIQDKCKLICGLNEKDKRKRAPNKAKAKQA